jgi:hypothetical protein
MSPRWGLSEFHHGTGYEWHSPNMSETTARDLFSGSELFVSPLLSVVLWRRENGKRVEVDRRAHRVNLLRLFG